MPKNKLLIKKFFIFFKFPVERQLHFFSKMEAASYFELLKQMLDKRGRQYQFKN